MAGKAPVRRSVLPAKTETEVEDAGSPVVVSDGGVEVAPQTLSQVVIQIFLFLGNFLTGG